MCTSAVAPSNDQHSILAMQFESVECGSQEMLLTHLSDCLDCRFAVNRQSDPLVVSGCLRFQELFTEAYALFDYLDSPLANVHMSEDMIDNYLFGRLSATENSVFEMHANLCSSCATALQNERMFIFAMKAAVSNDPSLYRNRNGAAFRAAAGN